MVPGASGRTLRQMLENGRVRVNGATTKVSSCPLRIGDVVEVGHRQAPRRRVRGIEILHEDQDLIVVCKPAGLLTVSTLHERERTAYASLRQYVKEADPRRKLFIVHRLDKFVSGLLVFAKSEAAKKKLQALFRRHDVQRRYWAIVEGRVELDRGTLRSCL